MQCNTYTYTYTYVQSNPKTCWHTRASDINYNAAAYCWCGYKLEVTAPTIGATLLLRSVAIPKASAVPVHRAIPNMPTNSRINLQSQLPATQAFTPPHHLTPSLFLCTGHLAFPLPNSKTHLHLSLSLYLPPLSSSFSAL